MEGAILEGCSINIEIRDINSDALLICILGLKNIFNVYDLEGATIFACDSRRFSCAVLDGFSSKVRSKLDMVEPRKAGESDYLVFGHG